MNMVGGDIDSNAIQEAFSKIKNDMIKLNQEMYDMKLEQKKLLQENIDLKQQLSGNDNSNMIEEVVKQTLKNISPKNSRNNQLIKRFNKKRKSIIVSRLTSLSMEKNLTLPEIKEIIVDNESLCSKATFYRYVSKLKSKGVIDIIKINELDVLIKV